MGGDGLPGGGRGLQKEVWGGGGEPKVNFTVFTILPDFFSLQMPEAVEYNPYIYNI